MTTSRKKRRSGQTVVQPHGPVPDTPEARSRGADRSHEQAKVTSRDVDKCKTPSPPRRGPGHLAPSHPRPRPRGHHRSHTSQVEKWGAADAPPVWRDARGYVRPPATMPGHGKGRTPRSKGRTYPPDPPTMVETVRLINGCSDTPIGHRLRAFIVIAVQTGMRIAEILALVESDMNATKGSILVRSGKGGKRRVVGMDPWGWQQFAPWTEERKHYPPGPVFCVLEGPTAGRQWEGSQVRFELHRLARDVGVKKRITPHQFRHAFASARAREKMPWHLLQQQLGHADLRVLSRYLSGISHDEVLEEARIRPLPTLSAPDLMELLDDRGAARH